MKKLISILLCSLMLLTASFLVNENDVFANGETLTLQVINNSPDRGDYAIKDNTGKTINKIDSQQRTENDLTFYIDTYTFEKSKIGFYVLEMIPKNGFDFMFASIENIKDNKGEKLLFVNDMEQGPPATKEFVTSTLGQKFFGINNGVVVLRLNGEDGNNKIFDNNDYGFVSFDFVPVHHDEGSTPDTEILNDGYITFKYNFDQEGRAYVVRGEEDNCKEVLINVDFIRGYGDPGIFGLLQSLKGQTSKKIVARIDSHKGNGDTIGFDDGYYYTDAKIISIELFNAEGKDYSTFNSYGDFGQQLQFSVPFEFDVEKRWFNKKEEATQEANGMRLLNKAYVYNRNDKLYTKIDYAEFDSFDYNNKPCVYTIMVNEDEMEGFFATTRIKITSTGEYVFASRFDNETLKGKTGYKEYIDNTEVNSIFGDNSLWDWSEQLVMVSGKKIKLAENQNEYVIDRDLIFRNYSTNNYDVLNRTTDLWIDLNGQTINVGEHSIIIEGNSKIHIINGTIKGQGENVVRNYGSLFLLNVDVDNTNTSSSCAILNHNYLFADNECDITAKYDGIRFVRADSRYTYAFDIEHNSIDFLGRINAGHNGIDIYNNGSEKEKYQIKVQPIVFQNQPIVENNNVEVKGGNYGIYNNGVTTIYINGFNEANNGKENKPITLVEGKTAFASAGGTARLENLMTLHSTGENAPVIELLDNLPNKKQELDIWCSEKTNYISDNSVFLKEDAEKLAKLSINSEGTPTDSKFSYKNKLLDLININNPELFITAGYYSSDIKEEGLLSLDFITIQDSGYYKIGINPDVPESVDLNKVSKSDAKKYFANIGTKNIYLSGDLSYDTPQVFTVYGGKNFNLNNYKLTNAIFVIDLKNSNDRFGISSNSHNINVEDNYKGIIEYSGQEPVITLKNGNYFDFGSNIISHNSPAVEIKGGEYNQDSNHTKVTGVNAVTVNVDESKHASVDLRGVTTGINGVAYKCIYAGGGNDDGVVVGRNKNDDDLPVVNGSLVVEDQSRLVLFEGYINVDSGSAIVALNGAEINALKEIVVNGPESNADSAFYIGGSTRVDCTGGKYYGKDVVVVQYENWQTNSNDMPKFRVIGNDCSQAPELYTTDLTNGAIVKFIGDNHLNGDGRSIVFEVRATGGYFNKSVGPKEFQNLDEPRLIEENGGAYRCIQYEPDGSQHPYVIIYANKDARAYSVNSAERYHNEDNKSACDIENAINQKQLDEIITDDEEKEGIYGVLIVADAKDVKGDVFKGDVEELYDIHVNKVNPNNDNVEKITETRDYQVITLSISDYKDIKYGSSDKIVIYHRHGDTEAYQLKKVSESVGQKMINGERPMSECYYVKSGKKEVVVITNRFSVFGIGNSEKIVPEDNEIINITEKNVNDNSYVKNSGTKEITRKKAYDILGSSYSMITNALNSDIPVEFSIKTSNVEETEKTIFAKNNITESNSILLEIDFSAKVYDDDTNPTIPLTDLSQAIQITVTLNKDQMANLGTTNKNYFVYRLHSGEIQKLPATMRSYLDEDNNVLYDITFSSDKFSAFAIISEDKDSSDPSGSYLPPLTCVD